MQIGYNNNIMLQVPVYVTLKRFPTNVKGTLFIMRQT